jgi:tetratricopeptide (TPR) repeat protein
MSKSKRRLGRSFDRDERRRETPCASADSVDLSVVDDTHSPGRRRASLHALLLPVLLLATLAAYQPVWHGGMLWDDEAHITKSSLQTVEGLWRIWFSPGASQQYYPLVHTAFWLQHRLWGDDTLGYHLVTIVLHALNAFVLVLILRRLKVPGHWLAGLIFALHPVHVESVAWISELKNTLSTLLYLAAAWFYLEYDDSRSGRSYLLATALFVLALFSKTVTATLPAALLVVMWWRRGRLDWRRDVLPLVPLLAIGVGAGVGTAWLERAQIGAEGLEFRFTLVERCLIAARAIWFYLRTLVWPAGLNFNYPRWQVSQAVWWQYLYPLAVAVALLVLWWARTRSRVPLASALLFCGMLFPALGFVNVFPFRYSFVADHFVYLASMPAIATAAAAATALCPVRWWRREVRIAAALVLCAVLGVLTWVHSRDYANSETLYRATLARNPSSWFANNNLGFLLLEQGRLPEAERCLLEAVRLRPGVPLHHANLGLLRLRSGAPKEAVRHFEQALRLNPNLAEVHTNLGLALLQLGEFDLASTHFAEAVRLQPDLAQAQNDLGFTLLRAGQAADAVPHLEEAVRLMPGSAHAYSQLCYALTLLGRAEEGLARCDQARRLAPELAEAYRHAGMALQSLGRLDEAAVQLQRAIVLDPSDAEARYQLGLTRYRQGAIQEAIQRFSEALRLAPGHALAHNDLGAALLSAGRAHEALPHFVEAVRLQPGYPNAQFNLAMVLHQMGRLNEAVLHYGKAIEAKPDDAVAHYNLGIALEELRLLGEAATHYREAVRLRPDFTAAAKGLARLERGK